MSTNKSGLAPSAILFLLLSSCGGEEAAPMVPGPESEPPAQSLQETPPPKVQNARMDDYLSQLDGLNLILTEVQDAASAEAAVPKIESAFAGMRAAADAMGTASEDLKEDYGLAYLERAFAFQKEKLRIEEDPALAAPLIDLLAELPAPRV